LLGIETVESANLLGVWHPSGLPKVVDKVN